MHEDVKTLGIGAELSAVIMEERFEHLDAPVMRVTYPDTHPPFSHVLEAGEPAERRQHQRRPPAARGLLSSATEILNGSISKLPRRPLNLHRPLRMTADSDPVAAAMSADHRILPYGFMHTGEGRGPISNSCNA